MDHYIDPYDSDMDVSRYLCFDDAEPQTLSPILRSLPPPPLEPPPQPVVASEIFFEAPSEPLTEPSLLWSPPPPQPVVASEIFFEAPSEPLTEPSLLWSPPPPPLEPPPQPVVATEIFFKAPSEPLTEPSLLWSPPLRLETAVLEISPSLNELGGFYDQPAEQFTLSPLVWAPSQPEPPPQLALAVQEVPPSHGGELSICSPSKPTQPQFSDSDCIFTWEELTEFADFVKEQPASVGTSSQFPGGSSSEGSGQVIPVPATNILPLERTALALQRERTAGMELHQLADYFHLPIMEAAQELNMCTTALKNICRRKGLNRWPSRKIQAINRRIVEVEKAMASNNNNNGDQTNYGQELEALINKRTQIYHRALSINGNN